MTKYGFDEEKWKIKWKVKNYFIDKTKGKLRKHSQQALSKGYSFLENDCKRIQQLPECKRGILRSSVRMKHETERYVSFFLNKLF